MDIDIKRLASLSRLRVTEEQEQTYQTQMREIVAMVEKLPPLTDAGSLIDPDNPMICREDIVLNHFKRDDILRNAPLVQAGCVVVPRVIETPEQE